LRLLVPDPIFRGDGKDFVEAVFQGAGGMTVQAIRSIPVSKRGSGRKASPSFMERRMCAPSMGAILEVKVLP